MPVLGGCVVPLYCENCMGVYAPVAGQRHYYRLVSEDERMGWLLSAYELSRLLADYRIRRELEMRGRKRRRRLMFKIGEYSCCAVAVVALFTLIKEIPW